MYRKTLMSLSKVGLSFVYAMVLFSGTVLAQPLNVSATDEANASYQVSRFIGNWGFTGSVYVNSRRQAIISPNLYDDGSGVPITIPFPTNINSAGYFLYVEGINEYGNSAITMTPNNSQRPDYVGIYIANLNQTVLAMPLHPQLPKSYIRHFAIGLSGQNDLLGRSSDASFLTDVFWLREASGVTHLILAPPGCALSRVHGINHQGNVFGSCNSSFGDKGFVWSKVSGAQLLPTMGLPGESFRPRAIDSAGVVYGDLEYLDPSTAPQFLKIAVKVAVGSPMTELPNSRVPSFTYPWNEGFTIRSVSPNGLRIVGQRPSGTGGEDILYLNRGPESTLFDLSSLTHSVIAMSGNVAPFTVGSISNSSIGGSFANWLAGVFLPAILVPVERP